MKKTIIEETLVICTHCGGRGQEYNHGQTTSNLTTCRLCNGSGQVVTKTVTRHEEVHDVPAAVPFVAVPPVQQRIASVFRRLFTSVPLTDAERSSDPDFGL